MDLKNKNFSLLINGNPRDFADNLDEVNEAHDIVNEIRQLIWQGESTLNLKIRFEELGLTFDNKMTNEEILKLMNQLDSKLMDVRVTLRAKNNRGIGSYNESTKYKNGFNSELLRDSVDLALLTGEEAIDIESIEYENIEQSHNEIMKLRELIWVEAMKEFKHKLAADGIELSSEAFRREDFFEALDTIDLKLKEIKISKETIDSQRNQSSIYKHGQASTILPISALKFALDGLTPEEKNQVGLESTESELTNDEQ